MNKLLIGLGIVALSLVTSVGVVELNKPVQEKSLGSVARAGEYQPLAIKGASTGGAVLTSSPGTLGSIVITGANTGLINVYNTTTTNANLRAGVTSTLPVLASIPASAAAGTYTFDVVATYGIAYEITGTPPTSTLTWR